jgi:perosamine synthetase
MADIAGARHAVATSSGTAALHAILEGMGIGPGDEVITTPFSFVATANAALYVGATPVFADIDRQTLNVDPERADARVTPRTRAILGVDVFGLPADWGELKRIAIQHELRLIDDGCEALGATSHGQSVGGLADATAFGFYPNKQITTGEGGCITTDHAELADIFRSLCNQGRATTDRMHHVRLGYNYRLSEVAAALGCAQLERFEELQTRRRTLASAYERALQPLSDDLHRPPATPGRSWFAYVIVLSDRFSAGARDQLVAELAAQGIESAPYFPCIHLQPLYRERFGYEAGSFPAAEATSERSLALPFFTGMSEDDVVAVADAVRDVLPALPRGSTTIAASAGD